ncbi:MAG: family 16 glycoside hydrolase [Gemmataceae bacterium]
MGMYWGSLYGEGVGGMIQAADPKMIEKVVKGKEANAYVITAKGTKVKVVVNGETMVDGDFPQTKDKKPFPAEGIIAFQAHAGYAKMRVEFADIQFTDLSKKK